MTEYAIIGVKYDYTPTEFQLILENYFKYVDPKSYGLDEDSINPYDYFVTSGDAIEKTIYLEKMLWALAGKLRKKCYSLIAAENDCDNAKAQKLYKEGVRPLSKIGQYESDVWRMAGSSRKLLNDLKIAKGSNVFLETEWNNHKLLCIPKNPRRTE